MSTVCKNCGKVFEGNYCSNCGQSAETHPINFHFLWHDILHGLFHYDHGVIYSLIQLFTRPGDAVREFIEGKRVRYFKPISLAVVLAILYGVLYHYMHLNFFLEVENEPLDIENINEIIAHHYYYVTLFSIPFFSIASFLVFRKRGYNFTEHIVLNAFYASQKLVAGIVSLFFLYFCKTHQDINKLNLALYSINFVLMYWTYSQFFNTISKIKSFFLTLISYLLGLILLFIALTAVLVVFFR